MRTRADCGELMKFKGRECADVRKVSKSSALGQIGFYLFILSSCIKEEAVSIVVEGTELPSRDMKPRTRSLSLHI